MKRVIVPLIALAFLSGCATKPETVTVVQEVLIPVPTKCKATVPEKPQARVTAIPPTASLYDKAMELLREHEELRRYTGEVEILLKACTE